MKKADKKRLNVAIVGGGPGSRAIMELILADIFSELKMNVLGVADINLEAEGIKHARLSGFYTTEDYNELYKLKDLDLIIELTGRDDVLEDILITRPSHVKVMDHVSARLFWDFIQIGEKRIAEKEKSEARLKEYAESLEPLIKKLKRLKEYNEKIINNIPSSLLVLDKNLNIKLINRTYQKIRGIEDEDVVGKNIKEVFPEHLLKEEGLFKAFEEVTETKQTHLLWRVKHSSVYHREKILNITISGLGLAAESASEAALMLIIEDVTERARLTEELRKKNEELENFVYVVSHDLKSPIVSIQGFSSILLSEYSEKLGEEGERYLERISDNSSRMQVLISDLLTLSRLGRVTGSFKDASSIEIVKRVCLNLKHRLKKSNVEISISSDLPVIHCDEERIYQVFENLLTNAIKFMGDTENREIEVGYKDKEDFHEFYVKDNGIGIDEKYHRKIFEIFQMLKEIEDKEGTGAGLVIVEKIIKSHGGRVWVESEKGKGATFYFTLPKKISRVVE